MVVNPISLETMFVNQLNQLTVASTVKSSHHGNLHQFVARPARCTSEVLVLYFEDRSLPETSKSAHQLPPWRQDLKPARVWGPHGCPRTTPGSINNQYLMLT